MQIQNEGLLTRYLDETIKLSGPLPLAQDETKQVTGVLLNPPNN